MGDPNRPDQRFGMPFVVFVIQRSDESEASPTAMEVGSIAADAENSVKFPDPTVLILDRESAGRMAHHLETMLESDLGVGAIVVFPRLPKYGPQITLNLN